MIAPPDAHPSTGLAFLFHSKRLVSAKSNDLGTKTYRAAETTQRHTFDVERRATVLVFFRSGLSPVSPLRVPGPSRARSRTVQLTIFSLGRKSFSSLCRPVEAYPQLAANKSCTVRCSRTKSFFVCNGYSRAGRNKTGIFRGNRTATIARSAGKPPSVQTKAGRIEACGSRESASLTNGTSPDQQDRSLKPLGDTS